MKLVEFRINYLFSDSDSFPRNFASAFVNRLVFLSPIFFWCRGVESSAGMGVTDALAGVTSAPSTRE